jgi:hypothetical protein
MSDKLLHVVSEICKRKGLHGKIMQDEAGKVHIFDCLHWTDECAYMLRFLLPNAVLSVEHSVSSLSNFVLVVQDEYALKKADSSRRRMLMAILFTFFFYIALVFLNNYLPANCAYSDYWLGLLRP